MMIIKCIIVSVWKLDDIGDIWYMKSLFNTRISPVITSFQCKSWWLTEKCQDIFIQSRAEHQRREARHRDPPEVYPLDDPPRPSLPKAGLGLVMMVCDPVCDWFERLNCHLRRHLTISIHGSRHGSRWWWWWCWRWIIKNNIFSSQKWSNSMLS